MIKKIAIAGILPIIFLAGCSSEASESGQQDSSITSGLFVPKPAKRNLEEKMIYVAQDFATNGSIEQIAEYSELVVVGKFTKFLGSGENADSYRLGGIPGTGTDLWQFEVSETLFGKPVSSLVVVRFDYETVVSDSVPFHEGLEAMLMLTREVNGARIIEGGDMGLFVIDDDGRFLRPESQNVLTKYATLDLAREFFGR